MAGEQQPMSEGPVQGVTYDPNLANVSPEEAQAKFDDAQKTVNDQLNKPPVNGDIPADTLVGEIIGLIDHSEPHSDANRTEIIQKVRQAVDAGEVQDNAESLLDLNALAIDLQDAKDESMYAGIAVGLLTVLLATTTGLTLAKAGPTWMRSVWTYIVLVPVVGGASAVLWAKHNKVKDLENQIDTQIVLIQSKHQQQADINKQVSQDMLPPATTGEAQQGQPAQTPPTVMIDGKDTQMALGTLVAVPDWIATKQAEIDQAQADLDRTTGKIEQQLLNANLGPAKALLDRFIWPSNLSADHIELLKDVVNHADPESNFWSTGESAGSNWVQPMFKRLYIDKDTFMGRPTIDAIKKLVDGLKKSNGKYMLSVKPGGDGVLRVDLTELVNFVNSKRG